MRRRRTNPEALKRFLLDNAKDKTLVLGAFKELQPFFAKAETGVYDLFPASELVASEMAQAISLAIGKKVEKVIFVSEAHPFPKPEWMSQGAYENSLGDSLGGGSLGDSLGGGNLESSLWRSLRDNFWGSLRDSLGSSLWRSLFYFTGFALAGKKEEVARLTPLVKLLPKAIPLGEKKDEPGVWLVLVA